MKLSSKCRLAGASLLERQVVQSHFEASAVADEGC